MGVDDADYGRREGGGGVAERFLGKGSEMERERKRGRERKGKEVSLKVDDERLGRRSRGEGIARLDVQ